MTQIGTCPRCKSRMVKEVNEREVFGATKTHVYSRIEKGTVCLLCGYRNVRFGVK